MEGKKYQSYVYINGFKCTVLTDSNSMISTMLVRLCLDSAPEIKCVIK